MTRSVPILVRNECVTPVRLHKAQAHAVPDAEHLLRQESFYLYLTGQNEPGQMVLIEVDTGK